MEGMAQFAKRIGQTVHAGWNVFVVVSAMGNTTNDSLCWQYEDGWYIVLNPETLHEDQSAGSYALQ